MKKSLMDLVVIFFNLKKSLTIMVGICKNFLQK